MKHLKLFFALFAMLALGVGNAWAEGNYVKVTTAPSDWSGDYLIVYEDGNVAFNGGLTTLDAVSNTVSITISDNQIEATDAVNKAKFTINASGHIKSKSGYYIGQTSNANGLKSSQSTTYTNTLTINSDASVNIVSSSAYLRYNPTSGQTRFRYYKSTSYTGQKAIHLYKYVEEQGGGNEASLVQIEKTAGKTEFVEGDSFEKATITATYDDETTKDVTALATFSDPNMNTIGEQIVSVSYTEGEVTAETSYTINITEKPKYTVTWKVNGEDYTTTQVAEGNKPAFPTTPESCDATSTTFYGWATEAWSGKLNDISDKTIYTSASAMPAEAATYHAVFCEGSGSTTLINEAFDDSSTTDSNQEIGTTFSNFDGESSKAFKSKYGGVKFGNSSTAGYITSKSLDLSSPFTVTLDACKFGSDVGDIEVTVGAETKTINNSSLEAAGTFNTYTLEFDAATATSTVKIATSQKRAYIDNVVIATKGAATNFVTTCAAAPEPAVLVSIAANAEGKNEFTEGDAFEKATITATYDDETTKDVTSLATFTGYDMNTTGTQTVNVTYEGKSTSYTITVNPKPKHTITWNNAGTTNTTKVVQGEAFGTLPEEPEDCDNGKKFMGWTAATEVNNDGSGIVYVKETDIPTSDMTYYAVFAVVEGGDETPTTATVAIADYATANNWANGTKYTTMNIDANITATANGGGNTGKYYSGNNTWRFYQNETPSLTIAAAEGYEIQTVKVTYTVDKTGVLTLEGSNVVSGTVCDVNAESVIFGVGNTGSVTNGQAQVSAIEVVYASAAKTSDYSLDCTINTNPEWTIATDEISFADKYVGVSYTETFTINASNLAEDIALAIVGSNFTVSPTSISKDATFPQTVTVTYAPTAVGTHSATLSITSGSTLSKSIALTGSATEATIYTLTALADIKPTDKVIIVGTSGGSTYAMSNDQGTEKAPAAVAVTVADNKIATNETNILWNIAKNGGNLTIYPADQTAKWLYCTNDNNGVRVGSNTNKTFILDATSGYLQHTGTSRYLGIYNNSDWRCYTTNTGSSNIKDQSFAFYVLPNTDPSISVTPASKDFGAVASGETATQEFEITTMNLTQALSAELTGEGFTKSEIVDNKITITFAPEEVKEYSATLTISAGTEASVSVTLEGEGVAATYSVTYDKKGAEGDAPTDDTKYVAGSKVTVAGQGDMTMAGHRFAGWKYGDEIYKAGAKFTMPETDVTFVAQWVEKEDFSTGYWVLVNDASELATNDYVVIAAADYNVAMKSYESGKNNCGQVEITKANNLLIWNENVGVFQLTNSSEKYTFRDVNTELYLYAAGGTSSNYLKANSFPTEGEFNKYYWTISIADGKATIKANVTETDARNWLRYNDTESGKLFSCYSATSTQKDIALYKYVTVPVVELHSGNNSALITVVKGKTVDVKLNRSFTAGDGYYTLCVPFDIAAEKIGTAYELGDITNHQSGEGGGIDIKLTPVTTIEAGVPYLVLPKTLTNPVFEKVIIENTTGSDYTITGPGVQVTFTGIINGGGDTNGSTEYYVGANGYLYNGTVAKLGLRAFFTITDEAGNKVNVRARVVAGENVETGVEDIITTDAPVKVIENGQLIIIRDGVKYNVQGQKL